MNRLFYEFAL